MAKSTDGRRNNKGVPKPKGEKKKPVTFYVKEKNQKAIKKKFDPIIKEEDERLSK